MLEKVLITLFICWDRPWWSFGPSYCYGHKFLI